MPAWPADLPQKPLANDHREQLPQLAKRTPMDVGPAKVRRRATAGVTTMPCPFRLSTAQRSSLLAFWQTTLAAGALSYTWTHPVTGAAITCRIVDPPAFEPLSRGLYWRTVLNVEILPA